MKQTILALTALAVVTATGPRANAGDHEWAVAGKVLTGVMAASVISHALAPAPVHAYPPGYCAQPAYVYAPAPVVVYAPPPRPVYYAPAPVYVMPPPPVVVYRPPCVAPAPVVGFHLSFGGGHHHRRGYR